jgi:hypothetical protein
MSHSLTDVTQKTVDTPQTVSVNSAINGVCGANREEVIVHQCADSDEANVGPS